jgi:hypothetical protein
MTTYLTSHRIALVAAGGLLTALALGGAAQAITDSVFKYSTAQTGYLTIDAVAMAPMNTAAAASYFNHPGGPLENFSSDLNCFGTGVNLPQGATITALILWLSDSGAPPESLSAYLDRRMLGDGTFSLLAQKEEFGDGTGARRSYAISVAPAAAKVSNKLYSYSFRVCLNLNDTFHTARITYTYTTAGD